jgi:hypothetical protein
MAKNSAIYAQLRVRAVHARDSRIDFNADADAPE